MKLIVVTDPSGHIVAIQEPGVQAPNGAVPSKASLTPHPGHHVHELDVPAELHGLKLHEIHERARVDLSGKQPRLVHHKRVG
jgi:hypothetical protein